MRIRKRYVAVFAVTLAGGLAQPMQAQAATKYTWSAYRPCLFLTDKGEIVSRTNVRWRINSVDDKKRRIDGVEISDPTNGNNRIAEATFAELTVTSIQVGKGVHYKPNIPPPNTPYNITLVPLTEKQMPYVASTVPMKIQFHLRRTKKPAPECIYVHSY